MARIVDIILSLIGLGAVGSLFWFAYERSGDRKVLVVKWLVTAPVGYAIYAVAIPNFQQGGLTAFFGLVVMMLSCGVLAVLWSGSIIDVVAKPLASLYDGGDEPPEPKPYYSIAISKQKRNKPLEAVMAIREQLAKFPNDYEGVALLAHIQAEDLKDLPSAEMTVSHFCEWEKAPPKQVSALLTQLADWHMKFSQDAHSASAALERIVEKYPDTDLALVAKQRIAHLGGTQKHLLAAQDRGPVFVPEGVKNVGLLESSAHLVPAETPPEEQAGVYLKHLQEHPDDTEAREKLAIIYARHYQRLDLATIELEQLIGEPNHQPKRIAHWLNLLADLQIHGGADYETARATLEKIVEQFPDYAVAEVARSRLAHLKLEFKALEKTANKTLGVYEQNIGLKGSRSY
jgi:predicted negative regulator of RcsB-dependent stress response